MNNLPTLFAKLAALYKILAPKLEAVKFKHTQGIGYHRVSKLELEYFDRYAALRDELKSQLPDLYAELPTRTKPDMDSNNQISGYALESLVHDLEYIFEVRANSKVEEFIKEEKPSRVFISHGRSQDWREVQAYIERDLGIATLELAQEANKGRTVLQKLDEESERCSFAVVIMTGDDVVGTEAPRVRENVMHEIGFFQGKLGLARVCLLYEEGANIPSNIHGVVYIPFPKGLVSATFGALMRELRAAFPNVL